MTSSFDRYVLLVLCWMSATARTQPSDTCPVPDTTQCRCLEDLIVDCQRQLTTMPTLLAPPSNSSMVYEVMLLSNNIIPELPANAFNGVKFKTIEILHNRGSLSTIDDGAFSGTEDTLIKLEMELSESASFPTGALKLLDSLLSLSITNFAGGELPQDALRNLTNLENLTLTGGKLSRLSSADFQYQSATLKLLKLSNNDLDRFPTDAVSSLAGLESLDIGFNNIQWIGKEHESALSGVAKSLRTLVMMQTHLTDDIAPMLSKLTSLVALDISYNYVTTLDPVIESMTMLVELKAQRNNIRYLTQRTFLSATKLALIDLSNNTLLTVDPDIFRKLRDLAHLNLEHDVAVKLVNDSFIAQRNSLTFLNLNYVDMSSVQWSPIAQLTKLKSLYLDGCKLGDIPDGTFAESHHLQSLLVRNNFITALSRRSLTGLEGSLNYIGLDNNRLSTVDQCTFYGFDRLQPSSVFLKNNPLACDDCNIKFMYDWYVWTNNRTNAITYIDWRCSNGVLVSNLKPGNFSTCNISEPADVCPDLTAMTTENSADSGRTTPSVDHGFGLGIGLKYSETITLLVVVAAVGSLLLVGVPLCVCNRVISRRNRRRLQQLQEAEPKQTVNTKKFTRRPASFSTDPNNENKLTAGHRLQSRSLDVLQASDTTEAAMMLLTTLLRNRQDLAASLGNLDNIRYHAEPIARPYLDSEIYDEINEIDDDKTCLATDTV